MTGSGNHTPRRQWPIVLFLIICVAAGIAAQVLFDRKAHFSLAGVLYLSSLVLFAAVLAKRIRGAFPAPRSGYRPGNIFFDNRGLEPRIRPIWEVAGFVAVIAVGVFFHFYRLDAVPPGFNHDSAVLCHYSMDFLRGKQALKPMSFSHYYPISYETFQPLVTALYMSFLGVVPLASKLSSATSGLASLIVLYFLARFMFGKRTALIASFFMSVCGWHFIFSRVGWHTIAVPLWETTALFLLFAAFKSGKPLLFGLAGAATAANLLTYSISRILIAKELAIAGYLWLKRIITIRSYWKSAVVFIVVFGICSIPVVHWAATHWDAFQGRTRMLLVAGQMTREGIAPLVENLKKTVLNFNYRANGDDFFINEPLLDFPLSVFFAFGFVICCVLFDRPRYGVLLIWFLTSLIPGVLSSPNPNHNMSALAPAMIIAALACDLAIGSLWRGLSRYWTRAGTALAFLAVAGALVLACCNYRWYISPSTRRDLWGFYPETRVVGDYMDTIIDDYEIYVADNYPIDVLIFLTDRGGDFAPRFHHLWDKGRNILEKDLSPPSGKGVAFIAKPISKNEPVFGRLMARYPGSRIVELTEAINPKDPNKVIAKVVLIGPEALKNKEPLKSFEAWEEEQRRYAPRVFTGGAGSGPGLFDNIMDLAVDGKGNIYAVDMANNRVQKFDSRGRYLLSWGRRGKLPGEFNEPRGIAVDRRGYVYVVDTWNHRVQKFSPEGRFIGAWTSPRGLYGPRGIAVGGKLVYVADSGNGRIEVFDTKGRHRASWGRKGAGPGEFTEPVGIAVDKKGFVYIVDSANNRIQKLDSGGKFLNSWNVEGWSESHLKEAYIECDDAGSLYIADPLSGSVIKYSGDGSLLGRIDVNLRGPTGVALSRSDLYISERAANRIKRKKLK